MAKYSLEQLRSKVWSKIEQARRDLKSSALPERGEDYELREYNPGKWMLVPFDERPEPPIDEAGGREQAVLDALRKKPGAKPKGEAEVIVHAKAPAKAGKASAQKVRPAPKPAPTPKQEETSSPPARVEPDVGQNASEPAVNDLSTLPAEGGPYEVSLGAYDGDAAGLVELSRKLRLRVLLRDAAGTILRVFDAPTVRPGASGSGVGKSAAAIALLKRPQGATKAEIMAVTEWGFGERYIVRLSGSSKLKMTRLGTDHWRLG